MGCLILLWRGYSEKVGTLTKVVFWLYESVVKAIMFDKVCWKALKKATLVNKLEYVQRAAFIDISGALRTTPTIALNATLHIAPMYIGARCISASQRLLVSTFSLLVGEEAQ